MTGHGIAPERIHSLVDGPPRAGRYVLYWMQQTQRAEDNDALELAVAHANELGCPTLVGFGLDPDYPEAGERAYRFMLEGLRETARTLAERGIGFVARLGSPPAVARALAADARLVVCDRGYLRHQRAWRDQLAATAGCAVLEVESDVVVPVGTASERLEVAARTLRPRLHRVMESFLTLPPRHAAAVDGRGLVADADGDPEGAPVDLARPAELARELSRGRGPAPVSGHHRGGASEAHARLERFAVERLASYAVERRRVPLRSGSELSMYLHFGQLSPVRAALRMRQPDVAPEHAGPFLEQLVVRRELAANFVTRSDAYDRYEGLPAWARATLEAHRRDLRPARYSEEQLVAAQTDDPYWNAAMVELRETGAMHPTMRMYWGKRLLAWAERPADGYERTLRLNNRYFLDGRDPNSYANVGWCYGLHDRPFPERAVFGTVRSMTAAGLRRKHDPEAYLADVARRTGADVGGAGAGAG